MGAIIEVMIENGFGNWISRYWPWSGLLVTFWLLLAYLYLGIEWWEQKKNKKKVYRILDRF